MKSFTLFFSIAILLLSSNSFAQKLYQDNQNITSGNPIRAYINLNNISTIFKNTGISDIDVSQQNSGFKYPKVTGKTAVYMSGLLWGVKIPGDPQVRIGGSTYREGLQGGKIISPGIAEDPNDTHVRIFRVRPDVYPGGPIVDLSWESSDEGKTVQEIRAQYELDWIEWRAVDGAPFDDIDSNGVYDPAIDIPGVKDAAQTIWFVANDLDGSKTQFMYGTDPIGIEYQATIWEYDNGGALDNLFFRRYKLINKSNKSFDSMYVSMWSDTDIGDANDDFVGCDTLLNLGFGYNGGFSDPLYGTTPPSVGFKLIRGPLVAGIYGEDKNKNGIDDASDIGLTSSNLPVSGFINLPMTAFYYFVSASPSLGDPPMGTSTGATQFYNFMQGKYGITGEYFINPVTSLPTTYALSGDPVAGTGWIDGMLIPYGDRRLGLSTGPFQMLSGETQTIVIAEIAGGASNGIDRLSAVSLMKYYSNIAQDFYDSSFPVSISEDEVLLNTPAKFYLSQNYPNPFNPSTTIRYEIPEQSFVTVKVYDILGNEVATLVNEEKQAGTYEVELITSSINHQPSSGVYFYSLSAGNYFSSKKMILLK